MKDRLVVLTKLGQGASSIVYKAFDMSRIQLVALKTVPIFDREKRHQMVRELNSLYNLLREREATQREHVMVSEGGKQETTGTGAGAACAATGAEGGKNEKGSTGHEARRGVVNSHPQHCIVDFYDAFRYVSF